MFGCKNYPIFKKVQTFWHHFPHAKLDEFVVMPNHFHGIIHIIGGHTVTPVGVQDFEPLQNFEPLQMIRPCDSKIQNHEPLHEIHKTSKPTQNQFQHIIPRSIGSIIRGFKTGVTIMIRKRIPDSNVWQRNYYEHIIRDEKSLYFIRKYIRENPDNWELDHENYIDKEIHEFEILETGCSE